VKFVTPKVYLVGFTEAYEPGIRQYLDETGQAAFWDDYQAGRAAGLSSGECLCSMYAKMCYKSLVVGPNRNISQVRSVADNLAGTYAAGHGSVFEHLSINFVVHNCSRVWGNEQVRHRVGVAYSQTSGRYVATDSLDVVLDPILDPIREEIEEVVEFLETRGKRCRALMGLDGMAALAAARRTSAHRTPENLFDPRYLGTDEWYAERYLGVTAGQLAKPDFDRKKKVTSALRRVFAPSGIANELGMTLNVRTVRHVVQLRTAPSAEWEMRFVYAQVYEILKDKFPTLFADAKVDVVDGLPYVNGMTQQPYDTKE
jgi:thymidylate synthase (FAD)